MSNKSFSIKISHERPWSNESRDQSGCTHSGVGQSTIQHYHYNLYLKNNFVMMRYRVEAKEASNTSEYFHGMGHLNDVLQLSVTVVHHICSFCQF